MAIKFNKIEQIGEELIIDTNDNYLFIKIIEKSYKDDSRKLRFSFNLTDDQNKIFFNTSGLTKSELLQIAFGLGSLIKSINFHIKKGTDISYFI